MGLWPCGYGQPDGRVAVCCNRIWINYFLHQLNVFDQFWLDLLIVYANYNLTSILRWFRVLLPELFILSKVILSDSQRSDMKNFNFGPRYGTWVCFVTRALHSINVPLSDSQHSDMKNFNFEQNIIFSII